MKKRIISFLILLTMLSTIILGATSNVVMAKTEEMVQNSSNKTLATTVSNNETVSINNLNNETATMNEPSNETYTLDELLNDEQEQNELKQLFEKVSNPIEEEKEEKAVLTTMQDITYKVPNEGGSSEYLQGIYIPGYDFFINTSTVTNTQTNETKSYFKIFKHDVINNTNKKIYDSTNDNPSVYEVTYRVRDDMLYILYVADYKTSVKKYSTTKIIGINLVTEAIVMKQSFNIELDMSYIESFAVDGAQRVYLPYKGTGLKVFDKNGKVLYDFAPTDNQEGKYFNYIKGISPNDKILFFEVMYKYSESKYNTQTVYEGMQKLNNGVFVNKEGWTVYGRTFPSIYSQNPMWYFIDDNGTYAVDQYGRIAKFNYNVTDTNMGVDREIVLDLASGVYDYGAYAYRPYYPNVCTNENNIYIVGANGNIYIVNKTTLKCTQYISTGIKDYTDIRSINYYEQSIFMLTKPDFDYYMKQIKLNNSNITTIQNLIISENKTTSRTISDIVAKYKQTSPKYDYNKSIYKITPSWKNPYKAGSLQDGVVTDTINRLNYYRWLVGVNEIAVNTSKLDRNQKGAVISKANGTISHYPTQPSDMDDAFYEEAYDGCNAKYEEGDTYSGNVSYGDRRPYQAIEGFVSDLYNVTIGSATGHRQSMLDPKATAISFGQCEEFSTASVYYDEDKDVTSSKFYAFPSAGYFPNTEMAVSEYWSIYLTGAVSGTARVNFTYKGKTYAGTGLLFESGYPALSFRMPDELQKLLGSTYDNIPGGTEIQVEVLGLKDENLNNVTYRYKVNFFDMKAEMPSPQDVADLIFDYKFYADNYPDLKKAFGYNEGALKNHWLTDGIKEGRQSSAVFDLKYYVYNNEDIKKAFGTNYNSAYNHFITTGFSELRPSSNEYYGNYYKDNNIDLKNFSAYNLMKHYMQFGRKEGRKATNVIDKTPVDIRQYLLDYNIYTTLKDNIDLQKAFGNDQGALKNHWETYGIPEGRIASLVFDAEFYLNKYADLKKAFGNNYTKAYEHFVTDGIKEGRQGSRYFDVKYYLTTHKDIKNVYGDNYTKALKHFVTKGMKEGRVASAEFNIKQYKENYEDLRKAYGNNYIEYYKHYINHGLKEGRNAQTPIIRKLSTFEEYLYRENVYLRLNNDVKKAFGNNSTKIKNHWITDGIKQGKIASLVFDAKYYLNKYPDLKKTFGNDYERAYNHFITAGIKEGRQGSKYFNAKYYMNKYPDLKKAFGTNYQKALEHFVMNGIGEGRVGSAEFNVKNYRANYKDLDKAYGKVYIEYYLHYMNFGIKEGRKPI